VPGLTAFNHFFFLRLSALVFIIFFPCTVDAQLCNGSLGDPVVNITFGPGGNSASAYVPSASYVYTSSLCPDDGFYTVTTSTSNCFGNSWHTVTSDHTGNGAFMLVNASFSPGDFFITTVTDLCPNTTYEFAAWIMNVMKPLVSIKPDIIFSIETPGGTVLNSFETGDIDVTSSPAWKQYGFFFTTPQNNPVIVLRITNKAPGGYGNDLALDDITFRPCGSKIDANIVGLATDTVDVCEGNTNYYTFNSTVAAGYISPLYQWQVSTDKGSTWKDIPGAVMLNYGRQPTAEPGNYWYRLTVVEASVAGISACRIASNEVIINVHAKPIVSAGPDRIVITGSSATLAGKAEGEGVTFSWTPVDYMNNSNELTPTVSPVADINYTLSAESSFGCTNEDNVFVKVVTGIYVPTAFTPNNDGKNDAWQIPFLDPAFGAEVTVFNRYGQVVYHTVAAVVSWDGTLKGTAQPTGTYVYLITFKTSSLKLKGTVTIIR
jgi:gliding motility-associated-like protein